MARKLDSWGTVPIYIRLDPADAERLDMLVEGTGMSVKAVISELIRRAKYVEEVRTVKVLVLGDPAE